MDIHNLDINMYSFKDILDLFNINEKNITANEIKNAKKTVLMTHPDKSKLDSKYFLFFKKAFDILFHYYENNLKQEIDLDTVNTDYQDYHDSENSDRISKEVSKFNKKSFNTKFNKLFEENASINKVDPEKNKWFKEDNPAINEMEKVVNVSSMNNAINNFKQKNNSLVIHKDIQTMKSSNGANLYEEDNNNEYVGSNIFDKLKYDDLRKVHKDETVFSVSENDISKVKQYDNIDHYRNARGNQSLDPMSESEANHYLNANNQRYVDNIRKHEQKSILQTVKNEENNKKFMASFLRIGN
jgi:hypothetical protein